MILLVDAAAALDIALDDLQHNLHTPHLEYMGMGYLRLLPLSAPQAASTAMPTSTSMLTYCCSRRSSNTPAPRAPAPRRS